MTEGQIIEQLMNWYVRYYTIPNIYYFRWETDLLIINSDGYVWEVEVKVSRSDYFSDFNKETKFFEEVYKGKKYLIPKNVLKHDLLKYGASVNNIIRPNKFIFAVPDGLVSKDEVPDYCGLIEVPSARRKGKSFTKQAPFLHKDRTKDWKKLFMKMYHIKI